MHKHPRYTFRLLLLLLIVTALLLLSSAALADVLIAALPEDVYAAGEHVTADTQVIVLTTLTGKEDKALADHLAQRGAPEAIQVKFKRLNNYKAATVKASWKPSVNAYIRLLTAVRELQPETISWYADPAQADLHACVGPLLRQLCLDADDPAVRGSDAVLQYGCTVRTLNDLATGEVTVIEEKPWMAALIRLWGDGTLPVIEGAPGLNEAGFLDEGTFVHKDPDAGVWQYISDSLRVTVTRHAMTDKYPHVWFEADIVRRDSDSPMLHCEAGTDRYKNTVDTLGMAQGNVLAINTDYYQYRFNTRTRIGLIVRAGEIVHDNPGKEGAAGVPNLSSVLLTREGGFSVYHTGTLTGEEALAAGAWDVLSFGPLYTKDGRWVQVHATHHATHEPRTTIARLGENHYLAVFAEGRLTEAKGMSLDEMQQLLLVRGATDAINLDGGRTACLYFMGEQLGSVGNKIKAVSPRGQWELLVIGDIEE